MSRVFQLSLFVISFAKTHLLLKSLDVCHWLCDEPKWVQTGCPGKGRVLKQTSAKARGNGGLCCGLAEAFSQDSTGGSVLAVGSSRCLLWVSLSVAVKAGIQEHLSSSLERHKQCRHCWEAEELLLGPCAGTEPLPGSPGGGTGSPTCPVTPSCPQPLLWSQGEMGHCQPWEWFVVQGPELVSS